MSVVSFALAVVFIIKITSDFTLQFNIS